MLLGIPLGAVDSDGLSDGLDDGLLDMDGVSEGIPLGAADNDGLLEGADDGLLDKDGASEGMPLGALDNDGLSDGLDDGLLDKDGVSEGMLLGSELKLGEMLGPELGTAERLGRVSRRALTKDAVEPSSGKSSQHEPCACLTRALSSLGLQHVGWQLKLQVQEFPASNLTWGTPSELGLWITCLHCSITG